MPVSLMPSRCFPCSGTDHEVWIRHGTVLATQVVQVALSLVRNIGSAVDGVGVAARRFRVAGGGGWEIDQGASTSTRTLPEISAFAAIANASLTSSIGST
jgi:hypothetical protein